MPGNTETLEFLKTEILFAIPDPSKFHIESRELEEVWCLADPLPLPIISREVKKEPVNSEREIRFFRHISRVWTIQEQSREIKIKIQPGDTLWDSQCTLGTEIHTIYIKLIFFVISDWSIIILGIEGSIFLHVFFLSDNKVTHCLFAAIGQQTCIAT